MSEDKTPGAKLWELIELGRRDDDIQLMTRIVLSSTGCISLHDLQQSDLEQFELLYQGVMEMIGQD